MNTESDNPTPPPEIAPYVDAFSPENMKKAWAKETDPLTAWDNFIQRIGFDDAVDAIDAPGGRPYSLAFALLELPDDERFAFSRQYPLEILNLAGLASEWVEATGSPDFVQMAPELVAPEVLAAFYWQINNRTAAMIKAIGGSINLH